MSVEQPPPPLTEREAREVLRSLAGVDVILVGGQAINVWATRYQARAAELKSEGPFTSKDIDLWGDERAVRECASRLPRGQPLFPDPDQHVHINSGIVRFVDAKGYTRELDVLEQLLGVDPKELKKTCVEIDVGGQHLRIMHPVLCMEGRVALVLRGRSDDHTLKQMRASVVCAREFLRETFDPARSRDVLDWNERIFEFARRREGRNLMRQHKIDVFKAVLVDERLPQEFLLKRYPQMQGKLKSLRMRGPEL